MEGVLIVLVASLFNANFTLPSKYAKRWDWEHAWGMWALWACLLLPAIVAYFSVPDWLAAYQGVPFTKLLAVFGASFIWGLSAIAFGLGVASAGISLGFSIIMALVITTGTLVPLVTMNVGLVFTATGLCIITGLTAMLAGVILCGKAGIERGRYLAAHAEAGDRPDATALKRGIVLCVLAGVFGPMINFAFIFGEPIRQRAVALGAQPLAATNAVWCLALLGGFLANSVYCVYLISRRRSWAKYVQSGTGSHWILGFLMGLFFVAGITLYGWGTARIGTLGTSIGWALFQGPTIVVANLSGFVTGEWKGVGARTTRVMFAGVLAILIGIIIIATANMIRT